MADAEKSTSNTKESDIANRCQSLSINCTTMETNSAVVSNSESDVPQPSVLASDNDVSNNLPVKEFVGSESENIDKLSAECSGISISEEELHEIFNSMRNSGFPITSVDELRNNFSEKLAEARLWARQRQEYLLKRRQEAEQKREEVFAQTERTEEQIRRACEMARAQVDNEYNELMSQLAAARRDRVSCITARTERLQQSQRMLNYYSSIMRTVVDGGAPDEVCRYMPAMLQALTRAREEHASMLAECAAAEIEEEAIGSPFFVPSDIPLDAEHLIGSFRVVESESSQDQ